MRRSWGSDLLLRDAIQRGEHHADDEDADVEGRDLHQVASGCSPTPGKSMPLVACH